MLTSMWPEILNGLWERLYSGGWIANVVVGVLFLLVGPLWGSFNDRPRFAIISVAVGVTIVVWVVAALALKSVPPPTSPSASPTSQPDHPATMPTGTASTSPLGTPAGKASTQPTPAPTSPVSAAINQAAEHYRRTSVHLKREEIRQGYKEFCDRIEQQIGLSAWAEKNHLTRMVTTNMGDVDAFGRAEAESRDTAWVALRVLVAFETARERPMYTSYVFVGRTPAGDEIVALYDEARNWKILSSSSSSTTDHEKLMTETAISEVERLTEVIGPDIRRLR